MLLLAKSLLSGRGVKIAGVAIASAAISFLVWDYTDAKSDRARLRERLVQSEQLTTNYETAINEFVVAENRLQEQIEKSEQFRSEIASELRVLREKVTAETLREEAAIDAQEATDNLNRLISSSFRLFDEATDPGRFDSIPDE